MGGSLLKLVRLDLDVCLVSLLSMRVLQKEMQVGLNSRVWSRLDIIRGHFLFVFVKMSQLFLHVFIFHPFLLFHNVSRFLVFHRCCSHLFLPKDFLVLCFCRFYFRISIFWLHLNHFWMSIESFGLLEVSLVFNPPKKILYCVDALSIDFLYHAGSVFHLEKLKMVHNILNAEVYALKWPYLVLYHK